MLVVQPARNRLRKLRHEARRRHALQHSLSGSLASATPIPRKARLPPAPLPPVQRQLGSPCSLMSSKLLQPPCFPPRKVKWLQKH